MKPTVWLHTDRACKFHLSIWQDPDILKIIPTAEKNRCLHRKTIDGEFEELSVTPADMPEPCFSTETRLLALIHGSTRRQ